MNLEQFNTQIASAEVVIVEFFAEWNDGCRTTRAAIKQISEQLGERLVVVRIDIDLSHNYRITKAYNIYSVPTIILFRNGRMEWRSRGVDCVRTLHKIIVRLLNGATAL